MAKKEGKVIDSWISKVTIKPDKKCEVHIGELAEMPPDKDGEDSEQVEREFIAKTKHKPHDDLVNAMKSLRRPLLDVIDMKMTTVQTNKFAVVAIKFKGHTVDETLKFSVTLAMLPKKFKKPILMEVPEIPLLDPVFYPKAEDVKKVIHDILKEAWAYSEGKFQTSSQLAFFKRHT